MRSRLRLLGIVLCVWFSIACASTTAVTAPAATAVNAPPPPPPVPQDALDLVPADAQALADIDLTAFTRAHDFTTWRGWATRFACAPADELDWLLGTTQRAIVASTGARPKTEGLVILAGKYTAADVPHGLSLLERGKSGVVAAPTASAAIPAARSAKHGRFDVTTHAALSATQLEGRLLIAGDSALLLRVLDRLDTPASDHFADTEPYRSLRSQLGCAGRAICGALLPGSEGARILKKQLTNVGMKALGESLADVPSGVMLDLREGLTFASASPMHTIDDAHSVEKQINDWLWQLGVFARLAGFPDVLDQIQVHVADTTVQLHLTLLPAALSKLEGRVDDMLGDGEGACNATAQPVAAPTAGPTAQQTAAP